MVGDPASGPAYRPPSSPNLVIVTIVNELSELQSPQLIQEQVIVTMGAVEATILQIDKTHPIDSKIVGLRAELEYFYTLQSRSLFQTNGMQVELMGEGSGMLTVHAISSTYRVTHSLRDDGSLVIGLVEG